MKLGCPSYKYEGVEPGFAERDLEDFDPIAEDLAWGRTLRVLRDAFGMKVDIERIRDQHIEGTVVQVSEHVPSLKLCRQTFAETPRKPVMRQVLKQRYCTRQQWWTQLRQTISSNSIQTIYSLARLI